MARGVGWIDGRVDEHARGGAHDQDVGRVAAVAEAVGDVDPRVGDRGGHRDGGVIAGT